MMDRNLQNVIALMKALQLYHKLQDDGIDEQTIFQTLRVLLIQCVANINGTNTLFKGKKFDKHSEEQLQKLVAQITDLIESHISDTFESFTK